MAAIVDIAVPTEAIGLGPIGTHESVEFDLEGVIGDGSPLLLASGPSAAVVDDVLGRATAIGDAVRLTAYGEARWLYQVSFESPLAEFRRAVTDAGGAVLEAASSEERLVVTLVFHRRDGVSRAHEHIESIGIPMDVRRVTDLEAVEEEHRSSPLTPTQYETLSTAHELGYFDVPRRVTLEELADELDVSHQALSERLRRSHETLVRTQLTEPGGTRTLEL